MGDLNGLSLRRLHDLLALLHRRRSLADLLLLLHCRGSLAKLLLLLHLLRLGLRHPHWGNPLLLRCSRDRCRASPRARGTGRIDR